MKNRARFLQLTLILLIIGVILSSLAFAGASASIPVTSAQSAILPIEKGNALPDMQSFIVSVTNGQSGIPTGVYVPGVLALKIVQQPKDNPAFVSTAPDMLTQFGMASSYFTVGLLAHNFLAGAQFANLQMDQKIFLVFGDGNLKDYKIRH